jgi:hypothetical protein
MDSLARAAGAVIFLSDAGQEIIPQDVAVIRELLDQLLGVAHLTHR